MSGAVPLPVHGFVLAGGQSSRMGRDKALLRLRGRPMVQIAVEKLHGFCTEVSLAGNREDLRAFAPVVTEARVGRGPAAGLEAGLAAASEAWAMFLPVDVPLLPEQMLQRWGEAVLRKGERDGVRVSTLRVGERWQPAICMVHRECLGAVRGAVEAGEGRLRAIFEAIEEAVEAQAMPHEPEASVLWVPPAGEFVDKGVTEAEVARWFLNVNTPEELVVAEAACRPGRSGPG